MGKIAIFKPAADGIAVVFKLLGLKIVYNLVLTLTVIHQNARCIAGSQLIGVIEVGINRILTSVCCDTVEGISLSGLNSSKNLA